MPDILVGLPQYWWVLVLLGALVGFVGGLLGLGGGVMLIPALILLLGYSQKSAQGISLAFVVPIALVGAIRYKVGLAAEFDLWSVGLLTVGGLVGILAGTALVTRIPDAVLRKVFACVLIVFALRMLLTPPAAAAGIAGPRSGSVQPARSPGEDGPARPHEGGIR